MHATFRHVRLLESIVGRLRVRPRGRATRLLDLRDTRAWLPADCSPLDSSDDVARDGAGARRLSSSTRTRRRLPSLPSRRTRAPSPPGPCDRATSSGRTSSEGGVARGPRMVDRPCGRRRSRRSRRSRSLGSQGRTGGVRSAGGTVRFGHSVRALACDRRFVANACSWVPPSLDVPPTKTCHPTRTRYCSHECRSKQT